MATEPPLDEIQWRHPEWPVRAIHTNSILFFFAASPFFDFTSNNHIIWSQSLYNESLQLVIATREAFEARLKSMSGLEFMVAQEPAETSPGAGTGVWVIRKQTRRKRPGEEDEITVHQTYFVVGENIYQAPLLSDVLGNRMLTITQSINKFFSLASTLPNFTPASGHTYLPPKTNTRLQSTTSQTGQFSKETTPLPDSLQVSSKRSNETNTKTFQENRLLEETLNITWKYGDEYMDEIPITGQPGDFHLSSTGRKEKEKLLAPPVMQAAKVALIPPTLKTDLPLQKKDKSGKSPRTPGAQKRRKSKQLQSGAVSPTAKVG